MTDAQPRRGVSSGAPAATGVALASMQRGDEAPQPRATPPALLLRRQRPESQPASPGTHCSWEARSEVAESEQVSAEMHLRWIVLPAKELSAAGCHRSCRYMAVSHVCGASYATVNARSFTCRANCYNANLVLLCGRCGSCQPHRCQHTSQRAAQRMHTHQLAAPAICRPQIAAQPRKV